MSRNRKPMTQPERDKWMQAAARVQVDDARQAAILGGILRSVMDARQFNTNHVSHWTQAALGWHAIVSASLPWTTSDMVDGSPPSHAEIRVVLERLYKEYGSGTPVAA